MILERGYLDHWKTVLLRSRLEDPAAAEIPIRLWEHCESRMDDQIADKDGTILAAICRWRGELEKLCAALIECRWIEKNKNGWLVRGWRDRQRGHFARRINGQSGGRPRLVKETGVSGSKKQTGKNLQVNSGSEEQTETRVQGGRGEEMRVDESRVPLPSPDRGQEGGLAAKEIQNRLCKIFNRDPSRQLGYEAEHALGKLLPISEDELAIVEWFYARPADPSVNELKSRHRSLEKLILNFPKAIDEARGFAKKTGAAVFGERKEKAGPVGWKEWHLQKFPDARVPSTFAAMPDYLQDEARRELGGHQNP